MDNISRFLIATLLCVFSIASHAVDVIEFEGIAPSGRSAHFTQYEEDGYVFRVTDRQPMRIISESFVGTSFAAPTGDYGFMQNSGGGQDSLPVSVVISTANGAKPFTFLGFDAAFIFNFRNFQTGPIEVTGTLVTGETISRTLQVSHAALTEGRMQSFPFDESAWSNLICLEVRKTSIDFFAFDNVMLTTRGNSNRPFAQSIPWGSNTDVELPPATGTTKAAIPNRCHVDF